MHDAQILSKGKTVNKSNRQQRQERYFQKIHSGQTGGVTEIIIIVTKLLNYSQRETIQMAVDISKGVFKNQAIFLAP
jgi:hypothetical protein